MSADPFRDRTERADGSYPESWPGPKQRPQPGQFIIGEVTGFDLNAGQYAQPVVQVLCEDTQREWSVWLPHYMADDITGQELKVGERISLKFYGLKKSNSGREYNHWGMMIDPHSRIATPRHEPDPRDEDQRRQEANDRAFSNPEPAAAPPSTDGEPWPDDDLPF